MVSDIEKVKPNNEMLVGRNWNCNEMTAGNTSGCALHQSDILIAIER